ncbi:MAG: DMT family transporter [Methanomicrobium sp.]|nr:DMT family transporter [Methanomicrobium sp.]
MPSDRFAYFKFLLALFIFGTNGIVASFIAMSSSDIVFLRLMLGSAFLLAIFLILRKPFVCFGQPRDAAYICVSGIAMGASWLFLYEAYQQIGVGASTLLYFVGPVIVLALSPFVFGERLTPVRVAGFFCVIAGMYLVNEVLLSGSGNTWGVFCGLMSAVLLAVMLITNKKAASIKGFENAFLQIFIGFLTVAVIRSALDGFSMIIPPEDIIFVLVIGIFNTGIGCYLYFSSLCSLPAQSVAVLGYIEPLSAVVFSALILSEVLLPVQILGAALILGGAFVAEVFGDSGRMGEMAENGKG